MSRINTNVSSLLAQRILNQQQQSLSTSLERLSTGLKINRGADDPAGLIASENLRSEQASITAATTNAQRADQVVNIAEGGLQEVSNLLVQMQGLVGQSANAAGLSTQEKQANQLQIDSILQTIDRIAGSTSFQGTKLLNGTYDFTVTNQNSAVADFTINAAKLGHMDTRDVQVLVTGSAQHGSLFLSTGGSLNFGGNSTQSFIFEVAGSKGSRQFTFASGTSLGQIATEVNTYKTVTGVSAITSGANGLDFKSTEYGSSKFVSLKIVDDAGGHQAGQIQQYAATNEMTSVTAGAQSLASVKGKSPVIDNGLDVQAIINGISATADGKTARINTDFLDLSLQLTDTGATNRASIDAFTITGGGAKFNLGPSVNISNQVSLGIGNVATRNLGNLTDGHLDALGSGNAANVVDGNTEQAQKIIDAAISQVSNLRGRLGAFQQNIVGATTRSLGVALENTTAAESAIRDTDFASQTAAMTRSQILVQAATSVLQVANSQPQAVLKLLG